MLNDNLSDCTRLEVIDSTGRVLVRYLKESEKFDFQLQDQSRTLKIFIENKTGGCA